MNDRHSMETSMRSKQGRLSIVLVAVVMFTLSVCAGSADAADTSPNNTFESATTVTLDNSHAASWFPDDSRHHYRIFLPQDGLFSLSFQTNSWRNAPFVFLLLSEQDLSSIVYAYELFEDGTADEISVGLAAGNYTFQIYYPVSVAEAIPYAFSAHLDTTRKYEIEPNNDAGHATLVNIGEECFAKGAVDYYRFHLDEAGHVSFDLKTNGIQEIPALIILFAGDPGEYIFYREIFEETTFESINTALGQGTYYIGITPYPSHSFNHDYSLKITHSTDVPWQIEPNNTIGTASEMLLNVEYAVQPFADDYYRLEMVENGLVELRLSTDSIVSAYYQPYIVLLNENDLDNAVFASDLFDESSYFTKKTVLSKGVYYVRISNFSKQFKISALSDVNGLFEWERNDAAANASGMALGVVTRGSLSSSADVDYYDFTLADVSHLSFRFETEQSDSGYYRVDLYSDTDLNTPIYTKTDMMNGAGAYSVKRRLTAGRYVLKLSAPSNFTQVYSVLISDDALAPGFVAKDYEPNDSWQDANAIPFGASVAGIADNIDVYEITAPGPGYFNINLGDAACIDTRVSDVLNGYSYPTGTFTDAYSNSMIKVFAPVAGRYYLELENDCGTPYPAYAFSVAFSPFSGSQETEPNNLLSQANPIALGSPVTGCIVSNENWQDSTLRKFWDDWYSVTLPDKGALSLTISPVDISNNGTSIGLGRARVLIYDSANVLLTAFDFLASDTQSGETIDVAQAGTYFVQIQCLDPYNGGRGLYSLFAAFQGDPVNCDNMFTQAELDQAVADATGPLCDLNGERISDGAKLLYTPSEKTDAVNAATGPLCDLNGNRISDGAKLLYSESEKTAAVLDAVDGLVSQEQCNQEVTAERLRWDVNGDNRKDLSEAIDALQTVTGNR